VIDNAAAQYQASPYGDVINAIISFLVIAAA